MIFILRLRCCALGILGRSLQRRWQTAAPMEPGGGDVRGRLGPERGSPARVLHQSIRCSVNWLAARANCVLWRHRGAPHPPHPRGLSGISTATEIFGQSDTEIYRPAVLTRVFSGTSLPYLRAGDIFLFWTRLMLDVMLWLMCSGSSRPWQTYSFRTTSGI